MMFIAHLLSTTTIAQLPTRQILLALLFCFAPVLATAAEAAKSDPAPNVLGFDHVGLVVLDLEASKKFFTDVLGFETVGKDADYPAYFLNNGHAFVTLWRANDPASANRFDRKANVGLHHMALRVSSDAALTALYEAARVFPGVKIEFAPELSYGGPAKHMMIYEPSGNRIELIFRPPN